MLDVWLDDDEQVSVPVFATTSPTTSFPSTPRRWAPQQEKLLQSSFEMIASLYAKVWSYLSRPYLNINVFTELIAQSLYKLMQIAIIDMHLFTICGFPMKDDYDIISCVQEG